MRAQLRFLANYLSVLSQKLNPLSMYQLFKKAVTRLDLCVLVDEPGAWMLIYFALISIVETYHRLLAENSDLIMPLAAIEAMIEALRDMSSTTVHETMDLLKEQSAKLQSSVANPIAVYHGTDLFQQYFLKQLKQPGPDSETTSSHRNFEVVREHLLRNGASFIQKAKQAREKIAWVGR